MTIEKNIRKLEIIKLTIFTAAVFGLGVLAFSAHASAAEYYISTNGSDSNNGSLSSPWATFNYAISRMSAGDTLIAKAGTYNQSIYITKSNITIRGELNGNGNHLTFINPGDILPTGSWSYYANGVWKASPGFEPWSMVVETGGDSFKITKFCSENTDYCNRDGGPLGKLQKGRDAIYDHTGSYALLEDIPWWDGLEAAYAYVNNTLYLRFRDITDNSISPTSKGIIKITSNVATIDIGANNNITIKDLAIRAARYGIYVNGGAYNTIDNNVITNGRQQIVLTGNSSYNNIVNNTLYAKSYSTFVNGGVRVGYGAWDLANQGLTLEDRITGATNHHMYDLYKYDTGSSSSCRDECPIWTHYTQNAVISGNHIYESDDGIALLNSSDIEISNNTIHDTHGNGIFMGADPANVSLNNIKINNNLIYNNNISLRWQNVEQTSYSAWVYNNRFWQPRRYGYQTSFHIGLNGVPEAGSRTLWIYHNTFSGGANMFNVGGYYHNSSGNVFDDLHFINNIVETVNRGSNGSTPDYRSIEFVDCKYNLVFHLDGNYDMCAGNTGEKSYSGFPWIWDKATMHDFNITGPDADSVGLNAVNAGIDISQPFLDYPALPGFSPNYFTGASPNMGWINSNPDPDNPADVNEDGKVNIKDIQAVIRCIINEDGCEFPDQSDVDGNGNINIKDIQAIIREIIR